MRPQHADLTRVRARAVGVLMGILVALTLFSFAWYLVVPRYDTVKAETTIARTEDLRQSKLQEQQASQMGEAPASEGQALPQESSTS